MWEAKQRHNCMVRKVFERVVRDFKLGAVHSSYDNIDIIDCAQSEMRASFLYNVLLQREACVSSCCHAGYGRLLTSTVVLSKPATRAFHLTRTSSEAADIAWKVMKVKRNPRDAALMSEVSCQY